MPEFGPKKNKILALQDWRKLMQRNLCNISSVGCFPVTCIIGAEEFSRRKAIRVPKHVVARLARPTHERREQHPFAGTAPYSRRPRRLADLETASREHWERKPPCTVPETQGSTGGSLTARTNMSAAERLCCLRVAFLLTLTKERAFVKKALSHEAHSGLSGLLWPVVINQRWRFGPSR
jgi:hypothetical protein